MLVKKGAAPCLIYAKARCESALWSANTCNRQYLTACSGELSTRPQGRYIASEDMLGPPEPAICALPSSDVTASCFSLLAIRGSACLATCRAAPLPSGKRGCRCGMCQNEFTVRGWPSEEADRLGNLPRHVRGGPPEHLNPSRHLLSLPSGEKAGRRQAGAEWLELTVFQILTTELGEIRVTLFRPREDQDYPPRKTNPASRGNRGLPKGVRAIDRGWRSGMKGYRSLGAASVRTEGHNEAGGSVKSESWEERDLAWLPTSTVAEEGPREVKSRLPGNPCTSETEEPVQQAGVSPSANSVEAKAP